MEVFATSKNTGPSWSSDPVYLVYIGTDLNAAIECVGTFVRYEREDGHRWTDAYPSTHSAIPDAANYTYVRFYMADGWWYSIVKFELE